MPRRILVLGTTGIDKDTVIANLRTYRESFTDISDLITLDFEKDFIESDRQLYDYLDAREDQQQSIWRDAWKRFRSRLEQLRHKDVLLSMHGVLARPLYGVRSPIHIDDLKDFKPTTIVTLIDDVYLKWFRTERRAGGLDFKGRPTLEQLLSARRAELFLADVIVRNISTEGPLKNYLLAVRHPARVLDRLLFGPEKLTIIYLSFPISRPRELAQNGDQSGIEEVNVFLRKMTAFERDKGSVVCFCPLAIDELPLSQTLKELDGGAVDVQFSLKLRWDVRTFWGADETLLTNDAGLPESIPLRREQVEESVGLLRSDVGTRDYRLVAQATKLAVFNPWFQGHQASGVDNEIACAIIRSIPVHVYQDPTHDPDDLAKHTLKGTPGSLGNRPRTDYITFHNSVEELLAKLVR